MQRATDARCVGSNPINKNYPDDTEGEERVAQMFTAESTYTYMEEYNGKFFDTSKNFLEKTGDNADWDRMLSLKIQSNNSKYWFAAHKVSFNPSFAQFGHTFRIPYISKTGQITTVANITINTDGTMAATDYNLFLRPIFILSPNVKIIDGEGTEELPFEIGL